jgi:terminase large subunit-like protein
VGEAATATATTRREAGHDSVIGCDWGRSNDFTVFVVVDVTARTVVALDRSRRVDYSLLCERLKVLSEQWQPQQIIAEQNGIGQPVIQQLGNLFTTPSSITSARCGDLPPQNRRERCARNLRAPSISSQEFSSSSQINFLRPETLAPKIKRL